MSEFDRVMESWESMSLPGVTVVRSYITALETEAHKWQRKYEEMASDRLGWAQQEVASHNRAVKAEADLAPPEADS